MRVLVMGAGGQTGRAVVERAVDRGHEVTAFVHSPDGFDVPGVRIVEGDATDRGAVDGVVAEQEAVIDTIGGSTPYKQTSLETDTANAIVAAMKESAVRRLVVTSMIGEGDSESNATVWERLLLATMMRGTTKDKAGMEAAVESTDLDWTIVRPPILSDDNPTGDVHTVAGGSDEKAHKITRGDLASFLVDQLSDDRFLRQAVIVAND